MGRYGGRQLRSTKDLRTHSLGARQRSEVIFMFQPFWHWGRGLWCPLNRNMGGPQSRSGSDGERKYPYGCCNCNPGRSVHIQSLHWLSCRGLYNIWFTAQNLFHCCPELYIYQCSYRLVLCARNCCFVGYEDSDREALSDFLLSFDTMFRRCLCYRRCEPHIHLHLSNIKSE